MSHKQNRPGVGEITRRPGGSFSSKSSSTPTNKLSARSRQFSSNVVRLPIFRDGVWICNEFVRIGPGLRARIREMAKEGSRS